jgi:xylulokinase
VYAAWCGTVAGESLEWYRRVFGGDLDWDRLTQELAGAKPRPGSALYLPHISGAVCPVDDNRSTGAFVGITPATTRADLLRAIIEGLNYQFLDIMEALQAGLRCRFDRVTAVGGGARNEFLLQNKADMTGLTVEVPEVTDATPLGAAMIAGLGVGLYADLDEACRRVKRPGKVFTPRRELTERYAAHFRIYRQLYPALKAINHRLYERKN